MQSFNNSSAPPDSAPACCVPSSCSGADIKCHAAVAAHQCAVLVQEALRELGCVVKEKPPDLEDGWTPTWDQVLWNHVTAPVLVCFGITVSCPILQQVYHQMQESSARFQRFVQLYVGITHVQYPMRPFFMHCMYALQVVMSLFAVALYIYLTYVHRHSDLIFRLKHCLGVFFGFNLLVMAAHHDFRLDFITRPSSLVDIYSVVPVFMDRSLEHWMSMLYLRSYTALVAYEKLHNLGVASRWFVGGAGVPADVYYEFYRTALRFAVLCICFAGSILMLEVLGDPEFLVRSNGDVDDEISHLSFVSMIYFVMETVTTVGYGDVVPKSTLGRVATMLCMVSGVVLFGYQTSRVLDLVAVRRKGRMSFEKPRGRKHVVLIGGAVTHADDDLLLSFITEILHFSHIDEGWPHVVLMSSSDLGSWIEELLEIEVEQRARQKVQYLVGSPLDAWDLRRADVEDADVVYCLADSKGHVDAEQEDFENIMRALSVQSNYPNVPLRLMLLKPESKYRAFSVGISPVVSFSANEVKSALFWQSCRCRGWNAMICNLMVTSDAERDSTYTGKILGNEPAAYLHGQDQEVYGFTADPEFIGMPFAEFVRMAYMKCEVIIFAVQVDGHVAVFPVTQTAATQAADAAEAPITVERQSSVNTRRRNSYGEATRGSIQGNLRGLVVRERTVFFGIARYEADLAPLQASKKTGVDWRLCFTKAHHKLIAKPQAFRRPQQQSATDKEPFFPQEDTFFQRQVSSASNAAGAVALAAAAAASMSSNLREQGVPGVESRDTAADRDAAVQSCPAEVLGEGSQPKQERACLEEGELPLYQALSEPLLGRTSVSEKHRKWARDLDAEMDRVPALVMDRPSAFERRLFGSRLSVSSRHSLDASVSQLRRKSNPALEESSSVARKRGKAHRRASAPAAALDAALDVNKAVPKSNGSSIEMFIGSPVRQVSDNSEEACGSNISGLSTGKFKKQVSITSHGEKSDSSENDMPMSRRSTESFSRRRRDDDTEDDDPRRAHSDMESAKMRAVIRRSSTGSLRRASSKFERLGSKGRRGAMLTMGTSTSLRSRAPSELPCTPKADKCTNCGNIFMADANFCRKCGHVRPTINDPSMDDSEEDEDDEEQEEEVDLFKDIEGHRALTHATEVLKAEKLEAFETQVSNIIENAESEPFLLLMDLSNSWEQIMTFIKEARQDFLPNYMPIVILSHKSPPRAFFENLRIIEDSEIGIICGSPCWVPDLLRSGVREASIVACMGHQTEEIGTKTVRDVESEMLDAEVVMLFRVLASLGVADSVFTVFEFKRYQNLRLLPKLDWPGLQQKEERRSASGLSPLTKQKSWNHRSTVQGDSVRSSIVLERKPVQDRWSLLVSPRFWWKSVKVAGQGFLGGAMTKTGGFAVASGRPLHGMELMNHPRFASGQIFTPSILGSMFARSFYMPGTLEILNALLMPNVEDSAQRGLQEGLLWQMKVSPSGPRQWGKLWESLYDGRYHSCPLNEDSCALGLGLYRLSPSSKGSGYVVTNPDRKMTVLCSDLIIVLASPSWGQWAYKKNLLESV